MGRCRGRAVPPVQTAAVRGWLAQPSAVHDAFVNAYGRARGRLAGGSHPNLPRGEPGSHRRPQRFLIQSGRKPGCACVNRSHEECPSLASPADKNAQWANAPAGRPDNPTTLVMTEGPVMRLERSLRLPHASSLPAYADRSYYACPHYRAFGQNLHSSNCPQVGFPRPVSDRLAQITRSDPRRSSMYGCPPKTQADFRTARGALAARLARLSGRQGDSLRRPSHRVTAQSVRSIFGGACNWHPGRGDSIHHVAPQTGNLPLVQ